MAEAVLPSIVETWMATREIAWFYRLLTEEELARRRRRGATSPTHARGAELRQRWECLETGKSEWRPLPVVHEGDPNVGM